MMTKAEFNRSQLEKMTELLQGPIPKTQKEKDIYNLKYMRYSIEFGSSYYRLGMIATLDRAIKKLEETTTYRPWSVNAPFTYKVMPDKVKKYMKQILGMSEYRKLRHAIRCEMFIMLIGPECSGKSTIREILQKIGYPYVIEDNAWGRVIKTSKVIENPKSYSEVFEELGIERTY